MTAFSKNPKADSLVHLSEEVNRIAGTLARLSMTTAFEPAPVEIANPVIQVATVAAVIRARRLRSHYFSEELFADPAWDILLYLLHADLCQRRVSVSSACAASAVPTTTALRWLKSMEKQGLIHRRDDPLDHRRAYLELAPDTSLALKRYFWELEQPLGI